MNEVNPEKISQALARHYAKSFDTYGATSQGVDWGPRIEDHDLRLDQMLRVMQRGNTVSGRPSLLDVGCGFGSLLDRAVKHNMNLDYIGIDVCEPMIEFARNRHPHAEWIASDFLTHKSSNSYDYVVCNGILTQKLEASIREMDEFLKILVRKMFALCKIGIAFNVMSTHVNFTSPNLYYRSPGELVSWCMSEISPRTILDCAYPLYEFTVYLYREEARGVTYGDHRAGPVR